LYDHNAQLISSTTTNGITRFNNGIEFDTNTNILSGLSSITNTRITIVAEDLYGATSNLVTAGFNAVPIVGTPSADTLTGTSSADIIYGDDGNDTIEGGTGHDEIYGNEGNDDISGGNGDDTIEGGNGDDEIYGGNGNDTIYGGNGERR
jgi:Ca2+-binding RTX toxin-like protein